MEQEQELELELEREREQELERELEREREQELEREQERERERERERLIHRARYGREEEPMRGIIHRNRPALSVIAIAMLCLLPLTVHAAGMIPYRTATPAPCAGSSIGACETWADANCGNGWESVHVTNGTCTARCYTVWHALGWTIFRQTVELSAPGC